MKVYNNQSTPLTYGDSRTVGGFEYAEGEKSEFEHLISEGFVIVIDPEPLEKPQIQAKSIKPLKPVPQAPKIQDETPADSDLSEPENQDTI